MSREGVSSGFTEFNDPMFIDLDCIMKSPLVDRTELVLDVVRRLVSMSEDGVIPQHAVMIEAENEDIPRGQTALTLGKLIKEGVLFEPGHGLIKLSG